jgi:hypothetical protein
MIPLMVAAVLLSQEGALDVLDGETLYEDGWLFAAGYGVRLRRGLLDGDDRIGDPLHQRQIDHGAAVSAHYGIRNTFQVGAVIPYMSRTLESDVDRLSASGLGDVALYAKWRFHRWDDVGVATNLSLLGGLELPSGEDDARDSGAVLPAELQPGSASWDPFLGFALTHEPGRWRFNAMALGKRTGEGTHDYKQADQFFVEVAAGNRFWLEPYPGPFMRADVMIRYRREWADRQSGQTVAGTGGDLVTLGVNWAFRPRPTLDFQIAVEVPLYEHLRGPQLKEGIAVFFVFGVRL